MSTDKQMGYAQKQDDDIIRSKTVGKLTSGWDNPKLETRVVGNYTAKLIGCLLYCG